MRDRETSTTERVGIACSLLYRGGGWPTRTIADKLGVGQGGAYSMLSKLSRGLPLTLDDSGWRMVRSGE